MDATEESMKAIIRDAACLAAVVLLTAAPFIFRLGFYSDDWALIAAFHFDPSRSLWDIGSLVSSFSARPFHGLYLASLYEAFGLHPLGYHLVNTGVLAASIAALYVLLLRLGIPRREAFAAAAILIFLPQLSTVRVWIAAAQIPLSLLFALASIHCQLSLDRSRNIGWLLPSALFALLSIASYEIFAPLIASFPLFLAARHLREPRAAGRTGIARYEWLLILVIIALVAIAAFYKMSVSDRAGAVASPERYIAGAYRFFDLGYDWKNDSSLNLFAALDVHFWRTLTGWARTADSVLDRQIDLWSLAITTIVASVLWWRLSTMNRVTSHRSSSLLLLGLSVFLLGHAIFLIVPSVMFAPTGMANRVLVAAAVGVAILLVWALVLAVSPLPLHFRNHAFSAAIVMVSILGTARVAFVGQYWAEAPERQRQLLRLARADLQRLPANATVILDGVCPYHGPAVVFETSWDVGGALSLALGRRVTGDTVSPRMSLTSKGLATSMYKQPALYPFGPSLYAYNPTLRQAVPLGDFAIARRYFAQAGRWHSPCPISYVGHGTLI
ncbi:MAG TPA: hypothetical protein VNI79_05555 [Sphingomicrobium sp.]|nr:hypothetical protein [Sphingomicrobium sp.]